jgi:hypothetical protein
MESERLYINNKLIELSTQTQQFARTLQVNDILSLDDRQTNFTKNIRILNTSGARKRTKTPTTFLSR